MCYNRDGKWDIFHKQLVNIKRQLQQEPTDGVKQSAALLCWVFIIGCKRTIYTFKRPLPERHFSLTCPVIKHCETVCN